MDKQAILFSASIERADQHHIANKRPRAQQRTTSATYRDYGK